MHDSYLILAWHRNRIGRVRRANGEHDETYLDFLGRRQGPFGLLLAASGFPSRKIEAQGS